MPAGFNMNHPVPVRLDSLEERMNYVEQHDQDILALRREVQALTDRVKQLEDAAGWSDGKHMENATAPVDTSWHPYDVAANTPGFQAPWGRDRRVVIMTRDDRIDGPAKADSFDWSECGDDTIVAWRYAKAGE